ncbi:MAG: hypothetical protein AAF967_09420, partial [Pseudomonadota bacterium]
MSAFAAWGCGIDISNINRRERRRALSLRKRGLTQSEQASRTAGPNSSLRALSYGFKTASPRVLLLGTAIASTFLLTSVVAPIETRAQVTTNCAADSPDAIEILNPGGSIICVNTEP